MHRRGFTLIEMAIAIGIGLLVAIAAFAAVDASSKSIAAAKRHALSDDLVATAVRWLRNEPRAKVQALTFPLVYHQSPSALDAAGGWPAHWPVITIDRLPAPAAVTHANGAMTATYAIVLSDNDGSGNAAQVRARYLLPITSLP